MKKLFAFIIIAVLLSSVVAAQTTVVWTNDKDPEPAPDKKTEDKTKTKESPKEKTELKYYVGSEKGKLKTYDEKEKPSNIKTYKISKLQKDYVDTYGRNADRMRIDSDGTLYFEYGDLQVRRTADVDKDFYYNKQTGETQTQQQAHALYTKWFDKQHQEYQRYLGFLPSIASLQYHYAAYKGMSGWSALIFDEEYLAEWRKKVNDIFCDFLGIGLGIECWTSKICAKYFDIDSPPGGVLYTRTEVGRDVKPFAHIEGERSPPIEISPEETRYIYKITFGLSNPKKKGITYHVSLRGAEGGEQILAPQPLRKGQIASALGAEAIIKETTTKYTQACLNFDSIETFDGGDTSHLCNNLVIR